MSERTNNLLKGFLVGGLIGVAVGILFTPQNGKKTREYIIGKASDLLNKVEEYAKTFGNVKKAGAESLNNSDEPALPKERAGESESKTGEVAHQGSEVKSRLKMAIEAGLEAYKEERNKRTA